MPATAAGIDRDNVAGLELAWSLAFPKSPICVPSRPSSATRCISATRPARSTPSTARAVAFAGHTEVLSGIRSAITVATLGSGKNCWCSPIPWPPSTHRSGHAENYLATGRAHLRNLGDHRLHQLSQRSPVRAGLLLRGGCFRQPQPRLLQIPRRVIALDATSGDSSGSGTALRMPHYRDRTATAVISTASGVSVEHPAVDPKRNRIYIGTGETCPTPSPILPDAIVALDMDGSALAWRFQALVGDAWNAARLNGGANCPQNPAAISISAPRLSWLSCRTAVSCCWPGKSPATCTRSTPIPPATKARWWHRRVSNAGIGPDSPRAPPTVASTGAWHCQANACWKRRRTRNGARPDYIPAGIACP